MEKGMRSSKVGAELAEALGPTGLSGALATAFWGSRTEGLTHHRMTTTGTNEKRHQPADVGPTHHTHVHFQNTEVPVTAQQT